MDRMIPNFRILLLAVLYLFSNVGGINGQNNAVKVAPVFQSNMVLQLDMPIHIWGTAVPGEKVEVSFDGTTKNVNADKKGDWSVTFPKRKASFQPVDLKVGNLHFTNILVGELWFCSGQSNMAFPLKKSDFTNWKEKSQNENIRLLRMGNIRAVAKDGYTNEELARCNVNDFFKGTWEESDSVVAANFSAVGWITGNNLYKKLNVPVGIIQVAVGGSAINNWLPPHFMKNHPLTENLYKTDWIKNEEVIFPHRRRVKEAFQNILKEGEPYIPGEMPYRWMCEPGFLYEAGIQPLKGLNIKGVLWYQGEAETLSETAVNNYVTLFDALVSSWRTNFQNSELPFISVQLPGFNRETWPGFREVQRKASDNIGNVYMVTTIDLGDEKNIHPTDKTAVGNRLADSALKNVYGKTGIADFPLLKTAEVKNDTVELKFDNCYLGWQKVEGNVPGFELAGIDNKFYPVRAVVKGKNKIVIQLENKNSLNLRYGWAPFPKPALKLFNSEGLPLGPFNAKIKEQN
ncbi:MAG: sialate O-acetylesterase [Bacteroidota bacterium]